MSNGNGEEGKIIRPEMPKDDVNVVLSVKMDPATGNINWQTKLPPPMLNWVCDRIKNHLHNGQPESKIIKSGRIPGLHRIKGAFGKK